MHYLSYSESKVDHSYFLREVVPNRVIILDIAKIPENLDLGNFMRRIQQNQPFHFMDTVMNSNTVFKTIDMNYTVADKVFLPEETKRIDEIYKLNRKL